MLGLARCMGALFKRLRQPPVVGEIMAGIILGPSLFGLVAPAAFHALFPSDLQPFLYLLAQVGLIFFMFLVESLRPLKALSRVTVTSAGPGRTGKTRARARRRRTADRASGPRQLAPPSSACWVVRRPRWRPPGALGPS